MNENIKSTFDNINASNVRKKFLPISVYVNKYLTIIIFNLIQNNNKNLFILYYASSSSLNCKINLLKTEHNNYLKNDLNKNETV